MSKNQGPRGGPSYLGWQVEPGGPGIPLVDYLRKHLLVSEENVRELIDFGSVQVNGKREQNPSRRLDGGEEIRVYRPWRGVCRHYEIAPERILYRDEHLLAYDKEAGVPSQPTPSDAYNNIFAALDRYLRKSPPRRSPYVALHHRLDQETSGVMIFAVHRAANRNIGLAFQEHRAVKDYLAWVEGRPPRERWTATEDISRQHSRYVTVPKGQGKHAETLFDLLWFDEKGGKSLLRARPLTGRTHQIRLHLAAAGHPVLGDRIYGGRQAGRLYLHAFRLTLPHPVRATELTVSAPVPGDWPEPHRAAIPD